ncbi:phosphogluconate dehydrogenase (NADP(+)-dependent, decarboxylating) [Chromatiales bacterium (ex Bugula neritina AB1)]|nr:phosphogluconate dehydrogenase (NADP(+)-dependent, decarboxylating) [Chromatiales bacterium (ex Bugula neritina AB1)]
METQADIALIGLAVMGQNLILNMNDHGYTVVAYNRTVAKTHEFLQGPAKGTNIIGAESLEQLVGLLAKPRKIMLMVRAGDAVDATINQLLPLLDEGDLIIDGGNSNFEDSQRRALALREKNLLYIGSGVSGGEEGARNGPSIMPGGNPAAWPLVKELFQSISAKTDSGDPCCEWVGDNGSGHFVKMVHNGIEYGDMQLICEAYHFMKSVLGLDNAQMQAVFEQWNKQELGSYLIEITADILAFKDSNDEYVLDAIVDRAGQKGTGKWTGINALELGVPLTLIGEAVFSRCLSAYKEERMEAENILNGPTDQVSTVSATDAIIKELGDALLAAKIISYTQGYMLMRAAADEYDWTLDYGAIAQMWRGGCIIRSVFLDDIKNAYDKKPDLANLLLDEYFTKAIDSTQQGWRKTIATAVEHGIPVPALSSALAFYDGYRTGRLPANMLQAQRDYFGAHTYERLDKPAGERFHTNWTGAGGDVSSSSYDA